MKIEQLTTPEKMEANAHAESDKMVALFEREFASEVKGKNYYHLVIGGEYSRKACDVIEKAYTKIGWKKVECRTSSEGGERPGLTGLKLYAKE